MLEVKILLYSIKKFVLLNDFFEIPNTDQIFSQALKQFEKDVKKKLGVVANKTFCPIKIGGPLHRFRYLTISGSFTLNKTLLDIYQKFVVIR